MIGFPWGEGGRFRRSEARLADPALQVRCGIEQLGVAVR